MLILLWWNWGPVLALPAVALISSVMGQRNEWVQWGCLQSLFRPGLALNPLRLLVRAQKRSISMNLDLQLLTQWYPSGQRGQRDLVKLAGKGGGQENSEVGTARAAFGWRTGCSLRAGTESISFHTGKNKFWTTILLSYRYFIRELFLFVKKDWTTCW